MPLEDENVLCTEFSINLTYWKDMDVFIEAHKLLAFCLFLLGVTNHDINYIKWVNIPQIVADAFGFLYHSYYFL